MSDQDQLSPEFKARHQAIYDAHLRRLLEIEQEYQEAKSNAEHLLMDELMDFQRDVQRHTLESEGITEMAPFDLSQYHKIKKRILKK